MSNRFRKIRMCSDGCIGREAERSQDLGHHVPVDPRILGVGFLGPHEQRVVIYVVHPVVVEPHVGTEDAHVMAVDELAVVDLDLGGVLPAGQEIVGGHLAEPVQLDVGLRRVLEGRRYEVVFVLSVTAEEPRRHAAVDLAVVKDDPLVVLIGVRLEPYRSAARPDVDVVELDVGAVS